MSDQSSNNSNAAAPRVTHNTQWGFGLLAVLFVFFLVSYTWLSWKSVRADSARELSSTAELSAHSLDSYFAHYEHGLNGLAQELVGEQGVMRPEQAQLRLKRFLRANPDLLIINISRPDGQMLVSSQMEDGKPLPSMRQSPSYIMARDSFLQGKNFDIGRPLLGPLAKEWVIPLRSAIRNRHGELIYIVGAVLPLSRQQSFWVGLSLPEKTVLGLLRDDRYLLSRYPVINPSANEEMYGNPRTGILVEHLNKNAFPERGVIDGFNSVAKDNYFFAFRRLTHYPLTLFVTTPIANIYSKWWQQAQFTYFLSALLLLGAFAVYRWTTRRQLAWEAERRVHEEKLRSIYDGSNDAIILLTRLGSIDCNAQALEMLGLQDKSEFVAHQAFEFSPLLQPEGQQSSTLAAEQINKAFEQGKSRFEWIFRRQNGDEFPAEVQLSAFDYGGERILQGTVRDTTERKAAQDRIEFLAYHDALTSLPNRLLAKDHLELAIRSAERSKSRVALLFLDLDNFKMVNDSLGHLVGDALLKGVAGRLKECLRDSDTLSRQGGDEFLIVLSDIRDTESISNVAEKVLERLTMPFSIEHHELATTLSIGIAVFPDDGSDFETLLKKADTAMYQAKEAGRNAYRFHTEQMNIDAIEHLHMRNGLRLALENGEFVLHYQPKIDLASGNIYGVEALIRWIHPEFGMIPPGRFIHIAEESGLIVAIGEWVLQEACRQGVRWREAGLPPLMMAVNLSAVQCKRGDIEKSVLLALHRSGFDPSFLELELTESLLIQDTEKILATMRNLKALGVQLSIDDFGTGYSSLSYLTRFNVDKLKIDQSFVRNMAEVPNDAAIVRAIIQMAKSLNLKTIAEGVENDAQLSLLRQQQCDEVQGYLFARPMPPEEFARYFADKSAQSAA